MNSIKYEFRTMKETVEELRAKTFNNSIFVEYYEWTIDEDTDNQIIIMEPLNMMTLQEYVECYGFLDETSISNILHQIFNGLEALHNISHFHGNMSIHNIFIDQNTMAIKLSDYGLYNWIYTNNPLEPLEGSKMDIFCIGILILKLMGKLRLNMPLDLGSLQYKVSVLKSIYRNESMTPTMKSFLDITFDTKTSLSKILIHPFISSCMKHNSTNDTSEKNTFVQETVSVGSTGMKTIKMLAPKDTVGEYGSEFTFGSGAPNSNSHSSKSSESNYFPPEVKKFLTKGSGLESSSGGVGTESQRTSFDYYHMHRFSDITNRNVVPSSSPAIPLRQHDRAGIKPMIMPVVKETDDDKQT